MSSVLRGFYWISTSRCLAAYQIIIWNCNIQTYAGLLVCPLYWVMRSVDVDPYFYPMVRHVWEKNVHSHVRCCKMNDVPTVVSN